MSSTAQSAPKGITVTYTGPWEVHLTYFKASGKYYSKGKYTSGKLYLFEIWEEVFEMLDRGSRPGLIDGKNYFHVLIEVPEHPHSHPHLHIATYKEEEE